MGLSLALAVVCLACSSCQQPQRDIVHDPFQKEQAEVEKTLREIYDCAQKKDLDRLASYHLYGPKFTDFKAGEPRCDAETNRRNEQRLAGISDFKYELRDLKVDVFGGVAVVTFHGEFSGTTAQGSFAQKLQSSMVFVNDGQSWKITHEHFSPLK